HRGDVDRGTLAVDLGEVLTDVVARTAIGTHHHRRDSLPDARLGAGITAQAAVGVRVDVDEPRRHSQPRRVDLLPATLGDPGRDRHDPVTAYRDVAQRRGTAVAVVDPAAADDQVVVAACEHGRGTGQAGDTSGSGDDEGATRDAHRIVP